MGGTIYDYLWMFQTRYGMGGAISDYILMFISDEALPLPLWEELSTL
jgi:hypothetical protein